MKILHHGTWRFLNPVSFLYKRSGNDLGVPPGDTGTARALRKTDRNFGRAAGGLHAARGMTGRVR